MSAVAPLLPKDASDNRTKEDAKPTTEERSVTVIDAGDSKDDVFSSIRIDPEDAELVDELFRISKKSPKLIRSTAYAAPADPSITLRSWKMNEFKYYDVPSPFPTLARGLFTQEIKQGSQVKHRIVARGYDKFFNIGEVPWTHVRNHRIYTPKY